MKRRSGIILLVFFCCICGAFQYLYPDPGKDSGSKENFKSLAGSSQPEKHGKGEEAVLPENEVPEAAGTLDFRPGMAESLVKMGRYHLSGGDSENALKYFRYYQTICEEMQDSVLLADAYSHLGSLYSAQNFNSMAEDKFKEALQIALLLDSDALKGKCYNQLGGFYYSQKRFSLAENYLLKSLSFFSSETDKVSYAASLHNLGMVMKARKNYRKSLEYLKEALAILQDHRNLRDLCSILQNIGEIYQIHNDYGLAEEYYLQALETARKAGAIERITESCRLLATLFAEKEQYKPAYAYQSLFSAYNDTLVLRNNSASKEETDKKIELERRERVMNQLIKEKELELLNREYKISRLELSRKNVLFYIAGSISLVLSLLVIIFYQRFQTKKRKSEQLELQYIHTIRYNHELQELNEKLQESEKQFKELNDTKDKFFSIISHDLRGPLNTLSGFIQIMKNGTILFSQDDMNLFSLRMERSLQGVTYLLDNLFQWASAQTGLIEFSPGNIRLEKLLKETFFLLQDTAGLKEITLEYSTDPGLLVYADIQMMRLLLRNMVSNAIKFTAKGGSVKVSAQEEGSWTVIKISDTGIGINAEERQKLLRDKNIHTRRGTDNEKGSGLGLILCKEFTEMHRGRIEVESAPGKGTTFSVYLPLDKTKPKEKTAAQV